MAIPFEKTLQPHTVRGVLLVIMAALVITGYNLISGFTIGGIIVGGILWGIAFLVALLILAPYLSSKDKELQALIKNLQAIDKNLFQYLPELIQFLPIMTNLIQKYGPMTATLLNQLLADQQQKNQAQVETK